MALDSKEKQRRCRARRIEQGKCSQCGKHKPWKDGQMCRICLDKHNEWYRKSEYRKRRARQRADEKRIVFEHYGNRCSCCGESELCFLAIDHIDGDGNNHRKKIGKWGSGFFKWLIKNGFPEGFQILCHNCNMGKHLNGGICPHKTKVGWEGGIGENGPITWPAK